MVVSKYAEHLPLYRQSQMLAREGVTIDRSTLAHWVGFAAVELQPLHDRLVERLKASTKLFADETRCPVLDPGRGKTKTGYLWAIARDDRPWGGSRSAGRRLHSMRRAAAPSMPPSCSPASPASCRSTAMPPTTRWPMPGAPAAR